MVNGTHDFMDKLWLEISLANIIRYTSGLYSYKVFVWNHNRSSKKVTDYLQSFGSVVEVLDENNYDMSDYDKEGKYIDRITGMVFGKGHNVHRTALQFLYQHATTNYDIDIFFTYDTDSWPIRNNWDILLVYALEHGYKLTGIWRNELQVITPPYVHPSCLGVKEKTIKELGLRFDVIPVFPKEDTLSDFTHAVIAKYGNDAILPVKRNNKLQYHSVFNGIYGGMLYHHHFGTRLKGGKHQRFAPFGWEERGEMLIDNKMIMDSTTHMLFRDPENFMNELAYGDKYKKYKIFLNYLEANFSRVRCYRLWVMAKKSYPQDIEQCFFLLTLVSKEFYRQKKFSDFYAEVCKATGNELEAKAYLDLPGK